MVWARAGAVLNKLGEWAAFPLALQLEQAERGPAGKRGLDRVAAEGGF